MKRFAIVYILLLFAAYALGSAPQPGWVTTAKVVEVYDGDTVTVEIRKQLRVRLLDCWAPEIRTRDEQVKADGIKSRDHLRRLIEQKEVILSIPARSRIGDSFSFDRALGRIYLGGKDVSALQVEAGYATKEKPK
jgi:endonuclease YncB( thermonuclease family)